MTPLGVRRCGVTHSEREALGCETKPRSHTRRDRMGMSDPWTATINRLAGPDNQPSRVAPAIRKDKRAGLDGCPPNKDPGNRRRQTQTATQTSGVEMPESRAPSRRGPDPQTSPRRPTKAGVDVPASPATAPRRAGRRDPRLPARATKRLEAPTNRAQGPWRLLTVITQWLSDEGRRHLN